MATPSPSRLSAPISEKDARAAADLAKWLHNYDMGEVIVLHTFGKERFRVRWDKDKGLKVFFPGEQEDDRAAA